MRFQLDGLNVARGLGKAGSHSVVGEVELSGEEVNLSKGSRIPAYQLSPRLGQGPSEGRLLRVRQGYETL